MNQWMVAGRRSSVRGERLEMEVECSSERGARHFGKSPFFPFISTVLGFVRGQRKCHAVSGWDVHRNALKLTMLRTLWLNTDSLLFQ
jgi:hypothetical protein